jgi:hypothetical protein
MVMPFCEGEAPVYEPDANTNLKRIAKYTATTGRVDGSAKLVHDHFLTSCPEAACSTVEKPPGASSA